VNDVQQAVIDTLAERALGVLSAHVIQVAALLAVGTLLALLWTGYRKAEIVALEGEAALNDPKVRWRLRSFAFKVGTVAGLVLLLVFLPGLLPIDLPLWVRLLARVAVAGCLAPAAGLSCHPAFLLWQRILGPLFDFMAQAILDRAASFAAGRKAKAGVNADGDTTIKPEATPDNPDPKTEVLGRPRQPD
jgi:hypothetical protein